LTKLFVGNCNYWWFSEKKTDYFLKKLPKFTVDNGDLAKKAIIFSKNHQNLFSSAYILVKLSRTKISLLTSQSLDDSKTLTFWISKGQFGTIYDLNWRKMFVFYDPISKFEVDKTICRLLYQNVIESHWIDFNLT